MWYISNSQRLYLLLLTDNFIPLLVTPLTSVEANLFGITDLGVNRLPDLAAIARRRKERVAAIVRLVDRAAVIMLKETRLLCFVVVTVDGSFCSRKTAVG